MATGDLLLTSSQRWRRHQAFDAPHVWGHDTTTGRTGPGDEERSPRTDGPPWPGPFGDPDKPSF
ncbi:hypothetical protein ACIGXM_11070 [Kitasatospora sp. NPDC052896]|uniref:hypothetical protein n=1 Tax=Kitasatospora sp. NPDC052896 TaxID=3364061 RepID=UPI0037CBA6B4